MHCSTELTPFPRPSPRGACRPTGAAPGLRLPWRNATCRHVLRMVDRTADTHPDAWHCQLYAPFCSALCSSCCALLCSALPCPALLDLTPVGVRPNGAPGRRIACNLPSHSKVHRGNAPLRQSSPTSLCSPPSAAPPSLPLPPSHHRPLVHGSHCVAHTRAVPGDHRAHAHRQLRGAAGTTAAATAAATTAAGAAGAVAAGAGTATVALAGGGNGSGGWGQPARCLQVGLDLSVWHT